MMTAFRNDGRHNTFSINDYAKYNIWVNNSKVFEYLLKENKYRVVVGQRTVIQLWRWRYK